MKLQEEETANIEFDDLSESDSDERRDVVAVDESMVKFKCRNSLKQYNTFKPISRGCKIWVLADKSGYFIDGETYTGKHAGKVTRDLGGNVVRKLTSQLKGGKQRLLDNYFTSYDQVNDLKGGQLFACGTVNKKRVKFPQSYKNDKDLERGEHDWFNSSGDGISAVKWKDKRGV
uniref:PiggyBac transposable element-derived protein domain-containing protein n=1 Tax=Octopus bimaculoides TaxID=37653 RepID=A0A0L8HB36_OCTBM